MKLKETIANLILPKKAPQSISFALLVHNEGLLLQRLCRQLLKWVGTAPYLELVIVDDFSSDPLTLQLFEELASHPRVHRVQRALAHDFGAQKNFLNSQCRGEWIFNLDADEMVSDFLLEQIPKYLRRFPLYDHWNLPRLNIFEGLRKAEGESFVLEHPDLLREAEDGSTYYAVLHAWPDWQSRLYRNRKDLFWEGAIHEVLRAPRSAGRFPRKVPYAIMHSKTKERIDAQSALYATFE